METGDCIHASVHLSFPFPPDFIQGVEFEDLETSMHLPKANHPHGNLYMIDPRSSV